MRHSRLLMTSRVGPLSAWQVIDDEARFRGLYLEKFALNFYLIRRFRLEYYLKLESVLFFDLTKLNGRANEKRYIGKFLIMRLHAAI